MLPRHWVIYMYLRLEFKRFSLIPIRAATGTNRKAGTKELVRVRVHVLPISSLFPLRLASSIQDDCLYSPLSSSE